MPFPLNTEYVLIGHPRDWQSLATFSLEGKAVEIYNEQISLCFNQIQQIEFTKKFLMKDQKSMGEGMGSFHNGRMDLSPNLWHFSATQSSAGWFYAITDPTAPTCIWLDGNT